MIKLLPLERLSKLVTLKSTKYVVGPVAADGYEATLHRSKAGVLIGEIQPDQGCAILVEIRSSWVAKAVKAATTEAGRARAIVRRMQREAIRQGDSRADVERWLQGVAA